MNQTRKTTLPLETLWSPHSEALLPLKFHRSPTVNQVRVFWPQVNLPIFKGTGSEDPEQFWFLCEAVWNAKNITDLDVRTAQLITSFRDRALT